MMSGIGGDLRYAFRAFRGSPGFTAVAVLSLALGVGVNTAIFSAVDQLLLRKLAVQAPEQLVHVAGSRIGAYPFYREFRDRNQVFAGLIASGRTGKAGARVEGSSELELIQTDWVSGNYFQVLGVGAARGRVLLPGDDEKPGGSPVVVLAYRYWEKRFNADAGVIGKKIAVNGYPLEIAGVAQRGFGGLTGGDDFVDVFSPITMMPAVERGRAEVWDSPNMFWLSVVGRLKPSFDSNRAQAALRVTQPQVEEAIAGRIASSRPDRKRPGWKPDPVKLESAAHGLPQFRNHRLDPLRVLVLATGCVLLIACANVANLLLARSAGRTRETAVRLSLGATRARLIRQLLTESLLLAAAGSALGMLMAYGSTEALARTVNWADGLRMKPDLRLLAFTLGVTGATAVLFGLAPALRATRASLAEAMKTAGGASQSGSRLRLGKTLIALQVSLSLVLLAAAGLFMETLRNLRRVDTGFQRENVLIADIDPSNLGYSGHRLRLFYDELANRIRALPGVRAASLSGMTPMGHYARSATFSAEGYQKKEGERLLAFQNPVSRDYFATMGIPMLLGRDFRETDEPAVTPSDSFFGKIGRTSGSTGDMQRYAIKAAIVNESLARKLWGSANPVGRRLCEEDTYNAERSYEVVGVVRDVRYMGLKESDETGMIYLPGWSQGAEQRSLALRSVTDPKALISKLREEVRRIDPEAPVLSAVTLEESLDEAMGRERMMASLSGFFAALALLLAGTGLYGVMAYSVARRTREIGIRMALGAHRGKVVRMIVRESLLPVALGVAVGLAATLAGARMVASLLFGVRPVDLRILALSVAALMVVAAISAAAPARRASRIEPTVALREE